MERLLRNRKKTEKSIEADTENRVLLEAERHEEFGTVAVSFGNH